MEAVTHLPALLLHTAPQAQPWTALVDFYLFPGLTFVFFLPCSPPGSGNEGLAGFDALLAGEALLGSCVSIDFLKQSLAGLQTQRTQNYVRNDGSSSAGPPSSCSQRRL